jgi:hypothetical protein
MKAYEGDYPVFTSHCVTEAIPGKNRTGDANLWKLEISTFVCILSYFYEGARHTLGYWKSTRRGPK